MQLALIEIVDPCMQVAIALEMLLCQSGLIDGQAVASDGQSEHHLSPPMLSMQKRTAH
jgi:hypothetical protein